MTQVGVQPTVRAPVPRLNGAVAPQRGAGAGRDSNLRPAQIHDYLVIRFDVTVAVLLAGFGAAVAELNVVVLVMVVLPLTWTVALICAAASSADWIVAIAQVTVPVCPTGGFINVP